MSIHVQTQLGNLIEASTMCRRIGTTTALVEAANKIGAKFVCANKAHAQMVEREHGIKTTVPYLDIRGTKGPYIWDHFTLAHIANEALIEMEKLEARVTKLEADISERTQREVNLRQDWLEARERIAELEKALEIERMVIL